MMRKAFLLCFLGFGLFTKAFAQLGGERAFEFLNIPNNARLAGLGGVNITSGWNDPTQFTANPALINANWNKQVVISRLGYFADISNTAVTYATEIGDYGTWAFNLSYFNYGDIESYDENGFLNGEFSVKEYAFTLGHSRQFGAFSAGANLKLGVSDLASFSATALMLDLGGTFKHPEKDLTVGMAIKNMGVLLVDYTEDNNSQLPLDVQLGFSYKPEFMPLRFSVTARNLNRTNATYYDPSSNNIIGEESEPGFGDELFRRIVIGTELMFSPSFQVRLAYNHLRHQELREQNAGGAAGFSFGFMLKVKRFEFAYSRALYHTAGGSNTLQLNISTEGLIKRKSND
ncbi:type IX secretion system protein PorQ [Roseivirga pacifica]|uniref:type IX secretion system protein PorQ n=1 Tax=Roseivirga pacifica TaxID=1267423 RepID=UPI003BAD1634